MLLGTLKAFECRIPSIIEEIIVVVPSSQHFALSLLEALDTCFITTVIDESSLLNGMLRASWDKYALQMAIKLLVAQRIMTNYYITLDADVVVVGPLNVKQLLPKGKAMFVAESQSVHPHWWFGSAITLGLELDSFSHSTFGVTPALLSTFGAQVATASLQDRFQETDWQDVWLESWNGGTLWSEYSLYRLALDVRGLFTKVHALSTSGVLCHAVWYEHELPWDPDPAFQDPSCVFSLVQSTTHARPSVIAAAVSNQLRARDT